MIRETFYTLPDGEILKRREVQTELADWVKAGPTCWVRKMRRRETAKSV